MGGESNIIHFENHPAAGANMNYLTPPLTDTHLLLRSVVFQVTGIGGDTPNIFLYAEIDGIAYLIDTINAVSSYVFPNVRVPGPLAFGEGVRIRVVTQNMLADNAHVYISFSELDV